MPPDSSDCYKIELIYLMNPHLIWIEVSDASVKDEYIFEQVGLYGILPLELSLDIIEGVLNVNKCDSWIEGATTFIHNSLLDCTEVWFSPTYIDKRSSIFDDNIHKFGEIILKFKNGKYKKLSKLLIKANLAHIDICEFHRLLIEGKLKTKLKSIQMHDVVKKIENFCINKNISKNNWKKSVEKQTSVFHMNKELDEDISSLTASNLEKHNDKFLNTVLENKAKDFELCKDIEEEPLGRGYVKSNKQSSDNQSVELKNKLAMTKNKERNIDLKQSYSDIKNFLDANAKIKNDKSKNVVKQNDNMKMESNFLQRKLHIANQLEKERLEAKKSEVSMAEDKRNDNEETISYMKQQEEENNHKDTQMLGKTWERIHVEKDNTKQIVFCPEGYRELSHIQTIKLTDSQDKNLEGEKNDISVEVDSDLNIETNKKNNNSSHNDDSFELIGEEQLNMKPITKEVNFSIQNNESSVKLTASSSLLKKKLKVYDILSKQNSISSKSSSYVSDCNKNIDKKFNDNVDEVINKINEEYKIVSKDTKHQTPENNSIENVLKNNVNPFRNIDPNISVFVDKLVGPVLLVHTKKNKRIQPICEMRDVCFNDHIRLVLRNMRVQHPMILQSVSWQTILRGYSLFMISPPHSGKTLGYLPAVCRLISDVCSNRSDGIGPVCIIVCATAKSVALVENMAKMFFGLEERVLACYAGVDDYHITTSLLNGCDLLICTPSSLTRLIQLNDYGVDLRRLSLFVLDDCERLAYTYMDEVKFFLIKIREMLKQRVNNELKVQYIIASRVWCDFMTPLAIKSPDTVISIGAFQECVLYSEANTSVSFVKNENKIDAVFEFLKEIDATKKTVIVCKSDDEVELLEKALKRSKHIVFACNNNMTVHDLFNLSVNWADYTEPVVGPILICCDGNLTHVNITDAHNLIHYSLPQLFSMFCKRFSVLNDNYPSIFKAENENVRIKIILDGTNVEQLPKILNFIKRCSSNVPSFLDDACAKISTEKELVKAKQLIPICDYFLILGDCPNVYNCNERHSILAEYDTPRDWMPKEGIITFKILHYHTAVSYSARLLTNAVNGVTTKYPQTYSSLSIKMGLYYSKESNRRLHGVPKIGDICAVSMKMSFFARCQVVKILSFYQNGNPKNVLVNLIDEEKFEITKDVNLYFLPEEIKEIETRVVLVRLANIQPKDKDITFSELAVDQLKKVTDNDDLFVKGHVALTLGNCVFIDTLEACQELTSLNETVVKHNLKKELLDNHALVNPDHIIKLEKLCNECGVLVNKEIKVPENRDSGSNIAKVTWAYLESDILSMVFLASAISPDKFFVRLDKFESGMACLLDDIQKYAETYTFTDEFIAKEGDLVLAEFPDDSTYERARIDSINGDYAKCFFVDQGDLLEISSKKIIPITEKLINQLPFQAIECRLIGIQPPGDDWPDFSSNWFFSNCYEGRNGFLKYLFTKYFTKETADFTNGFKYGVALIDTNGDKDVVINQVMVDLNLAQVNLEEREYLEKCYSKKNDEEYKKITEKDEEDWVNISSDQDNKSVSTENSIIQLTTPSLLSNNIIRSVPLVPYDSDDFEEWEVKVDDIPSLITGIINDNHIYNETEITGHDISENVNQIIPYHKDSYKVLEELDSDDLTTSEISETCNKDTEKFELITEVEQKRRPKLLWRQNNNLVHVKVQLIGVESYKIEIEDRMLKFYSIVNDTEYEFGIELYGVVNKDRCTHFKTGLYVMVKLVKVLKTKWISLTKSYETKNFIAYDADNIDTSSDEEEVYKGDLKNIIENNQPNSSDSEDEEFLDDANHTYKFD